MLPGMLSDMATSVVLALLATWCLVGGAVALVVGRAISWTWGNDATDETAVSPAATRPAVALPAQRSAEVLLDVTAVESSATVVSGELGRRDMAER